MAKCHEAFPTTHWSVVRAAGGGQTPEARYALAALCRKYWFPLYAYVRRSGRGIEESQDLTQEFFARFLEKDYVGSADITRGRFRTFLLAAFNHFLADEWDRTHALKRGRGIEALPLDFLAAENRHAAEPCHSLTPEKTFEREWALSLLDHVLARLQDEYARAGKEVIFEALKGSLTGEQPQKPYSRLGAELRMTEGAVKLAVHRLRARYGRLLHEELAQTVEESCSIEQELEDLFSALG